ncbi:hypothetical protein E4U43_004981 [Claviceps pusilla]|uniref:Mucoidy inhibitor-like protein n=1 Tax=Claviceps pusilla TaxID=123648 RepID=A0A9P7N2M8_9HYPO|nr:hypothetical protein E4U43_004981 [Claviceps pusilla]
MDSTNKISYKIRDLSTRSVTLFPSRAQIQRDIKNISLKPGTNEITIKGLSPTVDPDSIKVEGGSALIISDVSIETLPNREIFEEIYSDLGSDDPERDGDDNDDDDDDDDDDDQDDNNDDLDEMRRKEGAELKNAKRELTNLKDLLKLAEERVASANSRLKLLDAHAKALDRKEGVVVIEESLETYKQQRSITYEDYMSGMKEQRDIAEKMEIQTSVVNRLQKADDKARAKAEKQNQKVLKARRTALFKKARRQEERRKERRRIRREREKFWPKYCYTVKITLETETATPLSSRRTSISSEAHASRPAAESGSSEATQAQDRDRDTNVVTGRMLSCDLVLSYVTSAAYWVPSYDLQLSTTSATGTLSFDAEIHNLTSETWTNSKVVLSTSQATFSGLDDAVPTLNPWCLELVRSAPHCEYGQIHEQNSRSNDEIFNTNQYLKNQKLFGTHKLRGDMFGIPEEVQLLSGLQVGRAANKETGLAWAEKTIGHYEPAVPPSPPFGMAGAAVESMVPSGMTTIGPGGREDHGHAAQPGLFGAPAPAAASSGARHKPAGLFGGDVFGNAAPSGGGGGGEKRLFASRKAAEPRKHLDPDADADADADYDYDDDSDSEWGLSVMEETGLTSTYELPGAKTLVPKSTATKQRVAHLRFANVVYSYTVVAKYKPVAYLRAKFKNTSKMTLFKGRAGLSLDGSFMGRTWLPRCSAGDTFMLSLGVDPSIKVSYPKPVVQRASPGLFSKETTAVYTRTITLHNTRATAAKPTSLLVHDQVPLSQDENLRVDILSPLGLSVGSGAVPTGAPGLDPRENKDWGTARAIVRKDGEVTWDVSLNPGKAVRLTLEYGVAFPNGTYAR